VHVYDFGAGNWFVVGAKAIARMTVGYIGATIPAKVLRVSGTTLFQIAMQQTGDPLQWVAIAELNGLTDPWIVGQQTLLIPPVLPSGVQTGILGL
jgi:hypothetical protein